MDAFMRIVVNRIIIKAYELKSQAPNEWKRGQDSLKQVIKQQDKIKQSLPKSFPLGNPNHNLVFLMVCMVVLSFCTMIYKHIYFPKQLPVKVDDLTEI